MDGTKQEATAEQALAILDGLLAQVTQPPLTRQNQVEIQNHVRVILARLEQDTGSIQALKIELAEKQEYILQLERQIDSTEPLPEPDILS